NEPETSLHPDLLAPLGRLIRAAGERSQVMVVSHSRRLVEELGPVGGAWHGAGDDDSDDSDDADDDDEGGAATRPHLLTLTKDLGETLVSGQGLLSTPAWTWGTRR
ncbi:MAG: ATP-binding protein, partial [Humibacillus sp.]|nr:ATP-binding protein [Humibacillus sp.]